MNILGVIIGTAILWALTYGLAVPLAKAFAGSGAYETDGFESQGSIEILPAGAFILADVLVLGVAGLLLGALAGWYFIGFSTRAKMWPGMIALILTSIFGCTLHTY